MKKTMAALMALFLLASLALTACGQSVVNDPSTAAPAASTPAGTASTGSTGGGEGASGLRIGYVSNTGGLGDNSINDMVFNGIKEAADAHGVQVDFVEPSEAADIELYLTDFAVDGQYDLIVSNSTLANTAMQTVAKLYPEQQFLLVDNPIEGIGNVASLTYSKQHYGFLAGVAAAYFVNLDEITVGGETIALDNSARTLGQILGVENPDGLESIYGFQAGVKYVDPDIKILYSPVGSWSDQAKGREIALAQYDQGARLIFQDSGTASKGVFTAAADTGYFATGVNMPQHYEDPQHILYDAIKDVGKTTTEWVDNWITTGAFTPGVQHFDCEGGYCFVWWSEEFDVPPEMKAAVEETQEKLAAHEFEAPGTLEELEAFDLRIGA